MPDTDVTLSVLLGLEPGSSSDNTFTEESVNKAIAGVRRAARAIPALSALDVGPGVVGELLRTLATPVGTLAVNAWNQRAEIRKYGDAREYPPDETHEVSLYEHEIKQTIKPRVEVVLGPVPVAQFDFACSALLTFHGATLVIRGGKITHLRLGDLTATWELSLETPGGSAKLVDKDIKTWSLPGRIPLGSGIPISGAASDRPA